MNLSSPMQLKDVNDAILTPALEYLGKKYDSLPARVYLLTVGQQESLFQYRRQKGNGPAKGFWQFECYGGVKAVLRYRTTNAEVLRLCKTHNIQPNERAIWDELERNDLFAACIARLLVYTDPLALPEMGETQAAWDLYIRVWRPGKPHRHTWDKFYQNSMETLTVEG